MNNHLRLPMSSDNRSSQNIPESMAEARHPATAEVADSPDRQPDFKLEIQALQILDSSDDCIKVLDLEGHILFMSRGAQVLLGIEDITPFLNTSWIEFWQGADRKSAIEATARARAGEVRTFQGYCPTPSSEPKWWECKVSPMRGIDGQVERLLCISRDITERRQIEDRRKQAEEKLRESEELYRAIINQAVTGVACGDFDGNLTLVNQKYCDITGYCADELRQLRMQDITHPEDLPRNVELFNRMRSEGTPFEIEKRYIRKDGSIVWVNNTVSVIRDRDGNPQSAVAIVLDITDRKQAELSAEFLAAVTQNLAEATCVEDIVQTVGEQLHRYLSVSHCALIEVDESAEVATIARSWHQEDVPSLVGIHRLSELVTGEFFQTAKIGSTIIIRDVTTDPRIADSQRFAALKIGSFSSVPLIRDDEWKFTLGIYHQTPYNWRDGEIELMRELANRIWTKLERTRVEIALRQNQEMFSALVADAPFGVYTIDAEFRLLQANKTAIATFNIQPLTGRDIAEALRIIWQEPFATEAIERFRHTLATGESHYSSPRVERRADLEEIQSYDWQIHRITLPDGSYGVVCYFYDLSEIKRAEEIIRRNADRDAFLVTLNDALRPLTDASEIQAVAARILGECLRATRVVYVEVVSDGEEVIVHCNYTNSVVELGGRYRLEDYRRNLKADHQTGRTQVVIDIPGNPQYTDAQKARYREIDIAAHIDVPLIKNNQFVALLAAQQSTPRQWTEIEVNLVEETAERTWAAVERARVEAALRESEAKYRLLFNSMDEAYAVVEVMTGENGEWNDFLFLEVNPAFVKQTGMEYPVGRKATEVLGTLNPQWAQIYGRVAQTGEPIRFEEGEATLGRVFDLYVFRLGGEGSRRVAVLFTDITDRKRREANLAFLAEIAHDFSQLSTADEIVQTVEAKIGDYLQVTTCNFTDVDEANDRVTVHHGWSSPTVPSTVGTFRISHYFSQEFLQASRAGETIVICNTQTDPRTDAAGYALLNIHSFVTVPFHRNQQWTHYIAICHSQPRDWRDDEIQLIEEMSNRIFPRLERARTEQTLRESEAKYRSLFESINDGFALLEVLYDGDNRPIDCRFLEVSPSFEAQTTLRQAEGKTLRELIPSIEPGWFDRYHQALVTNALVHFEMRQDYLNTWFEVDVLPYGNPQNRQVTIVFRNIKERKHAEAALRESQERLQKAISIETVGVLFFTLDGRITDANDTFLRMSGYSRDELRNIADWQELTPPEFWDATSGAAEELAILGKAAPYEKQLIRKDGSRWWGLFSPTRLKGSGRNAECVEFVTDISDRKQAEAAIAADLRDTQLLRDLSAQLVTEDSIQGLYQEIMATAIALTQADAGTVQILDDTTQYLVLLATQGIEQKMVEHFHRVDASSNTPCGLALMSGVRSFVDFDVPESEDPDGSMRLHVEGGLLCAQSTPLISRSGKPIGIVSTHWRTRHRPSERELRFLDLLARQAADSIEQRQAEAQRKQLLEHQQAAREEAEQANRIKDEFLAVLSHELRSPLTPILGWSTLLLNAKIDATKTTQALSTIQRNAKLQSELIDDLLDIARIMRGKLSINVAPVNLASTVRAAMETVRLAAEAKSIQIAASLTEDVGLVLGDCTRLQQVVWNLLSNAVKFTPAGGQVSIRLERCDSSAQITVSDSGQGIAPDFLPHVFDYFRQADGATTRKFGGLGLGLAIVRQLVELHGGTVSVASPGLGQGTTFTVRVPLKPTPSEKKQDVRSTQQFVDLSGIKILIVDDETDIRELVAFVLEQQSAEVIAATSAREALLILPHAKPDILLSDIGMPEMDGYMLIRQVRRLTPEEGGDIPAIAVTAYAGDTHQQQVLAAGFQKHISKPIQPQVLVQAIAHLIHAN
ncbi:PAS domain S-box protein [Microcoleus sp. F8-D3]